MECTFTMKHQTNHFSPETLWFAQVTKSKFTVFLRSYRSVFWSVIWQIVSQYLLFSTTNEAIGFQSLLIFLLNTVCFVPCVYKHCLDWFKKERRKIKIRSVANNAMVPNKAAKLLKRLPESYSKQSKFEIATLISVIGKHFPKSQRNAHRCLQT